MDTKLDSSILNISQNLTQSACMIDFSTDLMNIWHPENEFGLRYVGDSSWNLIVNT